MQLTFFDSPLILENDLVKLIPLEYEHTEALWQIADDPEIWNMTPVQIKTKEQFEDYMRLAVTSRDNKSAYPFLVIDKATNSPAGSTRFGNIFFEHKRLEIGWTWYGSAFRGTGLNKQVKLLLLDYAFETLGLNRVELKTDLLNNRSQRAMIKLGFKQEGIFRQHIITDEGRLRDTVYFSLLKNEWHTVKEQFFS